MRIAEAETVRLHTDPGLVGLGAALQPELLERPDVTRRSSRLGG